MVDKSVIPPSPSKADYERDEQSVEDIFTHEDPFALFADWLDEARKNEPNDPNAMALSTVDKQGYPDVRMVLLKEADPSGFVFYTNTQSAKGVQLMENPHAGLCFHWKSLRRQVRVRGAVHRVSDLQADAYFNARARDSRIGAWASKQSQPLKERSVLEQAVSDYTEKFKADSVPRPDFWTGFCVTPISIEFWRDRAFRLHDRMVFTRTHAGQPWQVMRLYP